MNADESPPSSTLADLANLGRLFEEHRPRLVKMVQNRMDPALAAKVEAEDIVNEAFLEAKRSWPKFKQHSAASTYVWLYRLTYHRLIDTWRKHNCGKNDLKKEMAWPDQSSMQLGLGLVDTGTSPSDALARKDLCEQIRKVMDMLREPYRQILWMRHKDDLSISEIAEVLRIDPNTASVRYHRALGKLSDLWMKLYPETGLSP